MSNRPPLALILSALSLVLIATAFVLSNSKTAEGQVAGCDVAPVDGVIPRCLVVIKQTLPDGASQSFTINATIDPPTGPNINGSEQLSDGGAFGIPLGLQTTPTGTVVTVTENVPAGWTLASAVCDGAGITSVPVANGVQVTYTGDVQPFAYGVCTFTNQQGSTPTPTVTPTTTTTTATVTPTVTGTPATATPTFTLTPNVYLPPANPNVGGLGAVVAPAQPTRTPVPAAPPAITGPTSNVRPPSTGDAGLK